MQEKIEFFKMDSGKISIEYNAISGRVIIINGNRQILCQRDDPKFDILKLIEVSIIRRIHFLVPWNTLVARK